MAPTICSNKKRHMRPNLNEVRRHLNNTHLPNAGANIFKYATAGSMTYRGKGCIPKYAVFHHTSNYSSDSDISDRNRVYRRRLKQTELITKALNYLPTSDNTVSTTSSHFDDDKYDTLTKSSLSLNDSYCGSSKPDSAMNLIVKEYENLHFGNGSTCNTNDSNSFEPTANRRENIKQHSPINFKTVFNIPSRYNSGSEHLGRIIYNDRLDYNNSTTYSDMCTIKNTEGLLDIAIKTIKLVKRNQMLQHRLAQLQMETSDFIQSVLSNPENKHFRKKMQENSNKTLHTI